MQRTGHTAKVAQVSTTITVHITTGVLIKPSRVRVSCKLCSNLYATHALAPRNSCSLAWCHVRRSACLRIRCLQRHLRNLGQPEILCRAQPSTIQAVAVAFQVATIKPMSYGPFCACALAIPASALPTTCPSSGTHCTYRELDDGSARLRVANEHVGRFLVCKGPQQ